jgi:hypothetical protein
LTLDLALVEGCTQPVSFEQVAPIAKRGGRMPLHSIKGHYHIQHSQPDDTLG